MRLKALIFFLTLTFSLVRFPSSVSAQNNNQFITIVNPVRISTYNEDPKESIQVQYSIISSSKLPATWLLTYDAIGHEGIFTVISSMDDDQETGIFLEVTPKLAEAAGVKYNDTGYWHHANSVFLSGYTQKERVALIDTVFKKFREKFGFYPTSIGSWWTDSYSLDYMKQKYEISTNLTVADQFSTDGYQVWGQYWSAPFYPSKYHAGIPAISQEVKLDLVTIQWAPRDPLNDYNNSVFSTQDYAYPANQQLSYFEKLINLYAGRHRNSFGQITFGLEADLTAEMYKGEFSKQIELIAEQRKKGQFEIVTMSNFGQWYRSAFPELSPPYTIETDDLLGENLKVIWYQSPHYRIGLVHEIDKNQTKIFDFRTYHSDLQEPYYDSPNREFDLSIYIPSYFDEINNPKDVWVIDSGRLSSIDGDSEKLKMEFENGKTLTFYPDRFSVDIGDITVPKILLTSHSLKIKKIKDLLEITPQNNWIAPQEGVLIRDLTPEAVHLLKTRKALILFVVITLSVIVVSLGIFRIQINNKKQFAILGMMFLTLLVVATSFTWKNTTSYLISQGEIDALFHLSVLPPGKVAVYDKECLQCSWHTKFKPAIFANRRRYVKKYGKHPIVYNYSVFSTLSREEAKREFEKLDASYIYLSKFEDYIEKVPFSPGDLGIEKIYDNANAEIWKVK